MYTSFRKNEPHDEGIVWYPKYEQIRFLSDLVVKLRQYTCATIYRSISCKYK